MSPPSPSIPPGHPRVSQSAVAIQHPLRFGRRLQLLDRRVFEFDKPAAQHRRLESTSRRVLPRPARRAHRNRPSAHRARNNRADFRQPAFQFFHERGVGKRHGDEQRQTGAKRKNDGARQAVGRADIAQSPGRVPACAAAAARAAPASPDVPTRRKGNSIATAPRRKTAPCALRLRRRQGQAKQRRDQYRRSQTRSHDAASARVRHAVTKQHARRTCSAATQRPQREQQRTASHRRSLSQGYAAKSRTLL